MDQAAFKAEFTDLKTVRTRSVAQLVFELPIEQVDAALAILGGVPKPGNAVWVGIARLADGDRADPVPDKPLAPKPPRASPSVSSAPYYGGQKPASEARQISAPSPQAHPLVQRAGMLCRDERFRGWIIGCESSPLHEGEVAQLLREELGIKTRAELATSPEAQGKFLALEALYLEETGQTQ
jgi:hypothetical protein